MSDPVITPYFRVSFPNVFKPRMNDLSKKQEYSLVALFKKGEDLSKLKEACIGAATKKWGEDKSKWPTNLRMPFHDQGDRAKTGDDGVRRLPQGYEEGAVFLTLKSETKPGLVDKNNEAIIDPSEFYAGCWARAALSVFAYDKMGNRGVSFGLMHIQKWKDDEHFGNRVKVEDAFQPITDNSKGAASGESASDLFKM